MKTAHTNSNQPAVSGNRRFWFAVACLLGVLALLFYQSFIPGRVHFSNDAPLGAIRPWSENVVENFTGIWWTLNWLGGPLGAASPSFPNAIMLTLGAVGYAKFYPPFSLFVCGLCAWFFFTQLKFSPAACVLGGLAAALNSDFFSAACWGVAGHPLTFGMNFLALGLLADDASPRRWLRLVLAGFAVGLGLIEGADIGAIFSLYVAAYVVYQSLAIKGPSWSSSLTGIIRTAGVALCAAIFAGQMITALISTQIKGVAGMGQDQQTREQRWDWATQWSLPKAETLRVVIPGLFGYRMDTPDGGQYWGTIGRQPGWEEHHMGFARQSGGGIYAGLLVVLVAAWSIAQSCRKAGSPFSLSERKWIWFWSSMALISLLLSFGRHAPFYRLFYELPYSSTIRNPAKFMHCFNWSLVVLFAYGLHGLSKSYMKGAWTQGQRWFQGFERKWTLGLLVTLGVSVLGFVIYFTKGPALEGYLQKNAFSATEARQIVGYSHQEVLWYLALLVLSLSAFIAVQSRAFVGARVKWGWIALGVLLVGDLAIANRPWIKYFNYQERYVSNPVFDILRDQPHEGRVVIFPLGLNDPNLQLLQDVYRGEWLQHQLPYYGVQSTDIVQEPRAAVENVTYRQNFAGTNLPSHLQLLLRQWELTNVRYVLGLAGGFVDVLNAQMDPAQRRFRQHTGFKFSQTIYDVQTNAAGPFALIEFTGALPRAKLYSRWQTVTNDAEVLRLLASPEFNPAQLVLVADDLPAPAMATNPAVEVAPVEFVHERYSAKQVVLKTKANVPTVLLLNDKYDPGWNVTVDGQPSTLLRCNYLMRGVSVPPGEHVVEFKYEPDVKRGLVLSLASTLAGLLLAGYLLFSKPRAAGIQPSSASTPPKS